jgi:hypothetical protein
MSSAAIIGAAGSIGGALIGSSASEDAASTQASAADYAAQLQEQEAQNALDFQEQQWSTDQANLAPWLKAGQGGLAQLTAAMAPGGSLTQPFTPPTAAQAEAYPGYQFGLGQGEEAMQNSAASKGNLFSGNTQEALNNYGQQYAQQDYTNVYNQAYNTFETNQTNQFNRLAALSGIGQTAGTTLGQQGQSTANNISGIDLALGQQVGTDAQNAAAAEASGYVGSANAWSGALGGTSSNLTNLALLSQIYGGNYGAGINYGAGSNADSENASGGGSLYN